MGRKAGIKKATSGSTAGGSRNVVPASGRTARRLVGNFKDEVACQEVAWRLIKLYREQKEKGKRQGKN